MPRRTLCDTPIYIHLAGTLEFGDLHRYCAISLDVGDKDGLRNDTSKSPEAMGKYGIANSFELYQGTHTSAVAVRFQNYVLPFFSKHLCLTKDG